MLSPLSIREILSGKAAGNALIAAIPAGICILLGLAAFPASRPSYWLALIFAVVATYAIFAPAAAALSAIFPKTVDLNTIGNSSNAHQAAGLLGMLSFVISGAPNALLTLFVQYYLHRPDLVAVFLLGWCAIALGLGAVLFIPVRKLVAGRCETLAQYY
jgi:hypothetical protein